MRLLFPIYGIKLINMQIRHPEQSYNQKSIKEVSYKGGGLALG